MKNLANILTISRIFLALILLVFFQDVSILFLIIYAVAAMTDIFDGYIARKTETCSFVGAVLDSVADFILYANLIKLVVKLGILTQPLSVWLSVALCIGLASPIISFFKHKKIFFIHSVPCKIVAGTTFLIPFAIYFGFIDTYIIFTLTLLTYSMIEILVMSILLSNPDPNARSIISVIKENKATNI